MKKNKYACRPLSFTNILNSASLSYGLFHSKSASTEAQNTVQHTLNVKCEQVICSCSDAGNPANLHSSKVAIEIRHKVERLPTRQSCTHTWFSILSCSKSMRCRPSASSSFCLSVSSMRFSWLAKWMFFKRTRCSSSSFSWSARAKRRQSHQLPTTSNSRTVPMYSLDEHLLQRVRNIPHTTYCCQFCTTH